MNILPKVLYRSSCAILISGAMSSAPALAAQDDTNQSSGSVASDAAPCSSERDALQSTLARVRDAHSRDAERIKVEYAQRAQGIKDAADESKPNFAAAVTDLDVTIDWKDQVFEFDTPSAIMKEHKVIMGIPETWIGQQRWVFDLPATKMVDMQTGEYPEVTCGGFLGLECTFKWSPIITKVPTFYMERHEVSLGVPEFAVRDQALIFGVPEFFMQRQRIVLGLPEIIVRKVSVELGEIEDQSNALAADAKRDSVALTSAIQADVKAQGAAGLTALFQCQRNDVAMKQQSALAQIDAQIATSTAAVNAARDVHADAQAAAATAVVAQLNGARTAWEAEFAVAFKQLDSSEATAMQSIGATGLPLVSATHHQ